MVRPLMLGEVGGEHGSASHGKEGVAFADARELENNGGIEPTFAGFDEKCFQRILVRHGSTVGAVGGQRIVDVRDLQDPGFQRNGVATKAVRIAAAIHLFMVMANDGKDGAKRFEGRADFFSDDGMLAHDLDFVCIQRAGFKEDTFRHGKFADVMKPAGDAEFLQIFFGKTETFPQLLGVGHQQVRVTVAEVPF